MEQLDDEVLQEFLVESREGLDAIERDLLELETQGEAGGETLARVFRAMHSIKGTCGCLGFPRLERVAHVAENVLSALRDGKLKANRKITNALLATVDFLRTGLEAIETAGAETESDPSELISNLEQCARGDGSERPPPRLGDLLQQRTRATREDIERALGQQASGDPRHLGELLVEMGVVTSQEVAAALNEQREHAQERRAPQEASIRVDVTLLDKLMNLVGELVLARNQICQRASLQADVVLADASHRLDLVTSELQEGIMKTRMQPVDHVWSKLPRIVRDVASQCGKQVRVEMQGKETELDRTVIEAIKDPLTHLVRNAIDHGLELPAVRLAAGKPAEGVVRLAAFHDGGRVVIEIADDGGGIDVDRVCQKAIEKGVISPDRARGRDPSELARLVFAPGLSTAEKVTSISGRGVGMDVVKKSVEAIGGSVDVSTERGVGTKFRLEIPLTLAIVPALIVSSAGQRFAIPQASVRELVRLDHEVQHSQLEVLHGAPVFRLRGNLLPLVYLEAALNTERPHVSQQEEHLNLVVLEVNGQGYGLVVGEVHDTEEIVVKPLARQLKNIHAFAGATILGDGRVALILDAQGLAGQLLGSGASEHSDPDADPATTSAESLDALLLVRSGQDGRLALPLALVARLEEIPGAEIEFAAGFEAVQYRGQIMPLVRLGQLLDRHTEELDPDSIQHIVVHRDGEHSVGLVVDAIDDIVLERGALEAPSQRRHLLGSMVVQGRIVDVVDVPSVVAHVRSRWGRAA